MRQRNDRNIAVAVYIVAAAALIAFFLFSRDDTHPVEPSAAVKRATADSTPRRTYTYAQPVRRVENFPFDPNTADSTELLRLGLQPWQVRNIYRYRSRGGIYRTKEDFARLYGLTQKDYRRLAPYIRISSDYQPAALLVADAPRDTLRYPRKIDSTQHVVLNTADTLQLRSVPGIGSYYARQIVRYGNRLGGYVSVDQLDDISHFPASAKRYFVIREAHPRRLRVNRLSLEQLRRHPYLNYYQAKAITDYVRLHGPLHSIDDLRLLSYFPEESLRKLKPYLDFNQ